MALIYKDRVKETTATAGTGTITLGGAVSGFRTFTSALSNGDIVTYCIEDGTAWEVGQGTFTSAGTTLSRTLIVSSTGSLLNLSGSATAFLTLAARDVPVTKGVLYGQHGSSGCLAATFDRGSTTITLSAGAATSGTLRLYRIYLPAGLSITNISFWSGATALATGTNQWFGLFDSSRAVLAKTADDTSTAWGTKTKKTLAITGGPYVTTTTGWYYVGILIAAATVPTIQAFADAQSDDARDAAPITGGNSTTGLTTPASCTGTQTAITVLAQLAYAELS